MKVLSIKEPFASLIKDKKKKIETRSWRTKYRGELYIHASISNVPKERFNNEDFRELIKDVKLNHGHIICKCNLVDCIYMTKEYVENMKKNHYQEYLCGHYEEGRYSWVLDNIEPLKEPIKAKGQLSIWDYYNELEVMKKLQDIEYGWVDKDKNKRKEIDKSYENDYRLQSPQELLKSKIGVCWDQVELERYYFKSNNNIKTYFIVHYDNDRCPTHTFLTYEKNNKYYWFEHAWEKYRGIHEYNNEKEMLIDIRNKFIKMELNSNYQKNNLLLREYFKPKYNLSVKEFFNHCEKNNPIDLDNL